MNNSELIALVESLRQSCFFCSRRIEDKKTLEHIIPDSLLGRLRIKEELVQGLGSFQYSRVKVPAHQTCNNEFGSAYEQRVLELLVNPAKLYQELISDDRAILLEYQPNQSATLVLSTWLAKIYYGLYYNDFLKVDDDTGRSIFADIISSPNFRIVQQAYRDGEGFCLPSSLYAFESRNEHFDLRTHVFPKSILLKIESLTLILCIEDGFLTKNYLDGDLLANFREFLKKQEGLHSNFSSHLYAFAEIQALRSCIPKSPSFLYSDKHVVNMSTFTLAANPSQRYWVNDEEVRTLREAIFTELVKSK